jgi:hypothetical protein
VPVGDLRGQPVGRASDHVQLLGELRGRLRVRGRPAAVEVAV